MGTEVPVHWPGLASLVVLKLRLLPPKTTRKQFDDHTFQKEI